MVAAVSSSSPSSISLSDRAVTSHRAASTPEAVSSSNTLHDNQGAIGMPRIDLVVEPRATSGPDCCALQRLP